MLMHIRRLCSTKFNTEEYYGLPQVFSSEDEWTWERTEEISKYPNPGKPCNLYAGETPESSPNRQLNAATQLKHEKTWKHTATISCLPPTFTLLLSACSPSAHGKFISSSVFWIYDFPTKINCKILLSTLEAFEIVAIPWSKYHLWVMTAFLQADRLCGFTMHNRIVTQSNKQHMIFTIFWRVTCTPQCSILWQRSWLSFTVSSSFSDLLARQLRCCRRLEIVSNLHWTHKHWKEKCLGCTCPAVLISDSERLQPIRSALLARQNLLLEIGLVSFWTDLLEKTTELWRTFCLFHLLSLPPLTSKSFRHVFGLEGQAVLCLQAPAWLVCPTPKYCAGRNESAWCRLHFWWLIE